MKKRTKHIILRELRVGWPIIAVLIVLAVGFTMKGLGKW